MAESISVAAVPDMVTAGDPPVVQGEFISTLNVDNMIEKLLNFKNTGKQAGTLLYSAAAPYCMLQKS